MREIWLSSEDTGAYGRDIGSSLPELLQALIRVLPSDNSVMLRVTLSLRGPSLPSLPLPCVACPVSPVSSTLSNHNKQRILDSS